MQNQRINEYVDGWMDGWMDGWDGMDGSMNSNFIKAQRGSFKVRHPTAQTIPYTNAQTWQFRLQLKCTKIHTVAKTLKHYKLYHYIVTQ
jgi:hypothetical protein